MARPLLLGLRTSRHDLDRESAKAILASSSARRLDNLLPDWRERFTALNLYWGHDDHEPHLEEILRTFRPRVVVALGLDVARVIPVPAVVDWFEWWTYPEPLVDGELSVLKFPHPSGLSRLWNDLAFRRRASGALRSAAEMTET